MVRVRDLLSVGLDDGDVLDGLGDNVAVIRIMDAQPLHVFAPGQAQQLSKLVGQVSSVIDQIAGGFQNGALNQIKRVWFL